MGTEAERTQEDPAGTRSEPCCGGWGRLRVALVLALVPLCVVGPGLLPGRVFLPQLPVALAPLSSESPEAAARAAQDANLCAADRLYPTLTDQRAARAALGSGELPLWDPDLGLGLPLFAGSIAGLAYPPNWLALLLPPEHAAGALALLSLWLAGLGALLFFQRRGLAPGAVLFGALAYQLGGWGTANLFDAMKVDSALWFPWSLWAIEGIARGSKRAPFALALCAGLPFLAGFPPIALFAAFGAGLWALARLAPMGARPLGAAALALVAAGLVGAPKLVPMAECSNMSVRQSRGAEAGVRDALPLESSYGFVVPALFGDPREPVYPGALPVAMWVADPEEGEQARAANALEWNTWVGAVCVVLALVGLIASPRRALLPALLLALVLGHAQAWWPLRWLYALPGLNLGLPGRVLCLAWFLWPWLAAIGVDALLARRARALGGALWASGALALVALVWWARHDPALWAEELELALSARYELALELVREVVDPGQALVAGQRLLHSAAAVVGSSLSLLAALVLLARAREGRTARVLGLALVAACALAPRLVAGSEDVLRVGACALASVGLLALARPALLGVLPLVLALALEGGFGAQPWTLPRDLGQDALFPDSEAIAAVAEAAGDGRVLRLAPGGIGEVEALAKPNLLHAYGVADLTPYQVFTLERVRDLFVALDPGAQFRSGFACLSQPELLDAALLDRMRVTAILSVAPVQHARLEPVLERPGFHVYRRSGALPIARVASRAEVVEDQDELLRRVAQSRELPSSLVLLDEAPDVGLAATSAGGRVSSVERPSPGRLDVVVEDSGGGWLVMQEAWYPGWRATVNGEPAEVLRADGCFRAVALPEGERIVVETRFAPRSHQLGLLLALIGLLLGALAMRLVD